MKIRSLESSFLHKLPKPSSTFPFFASRSGTVFLKRTRAAQDRYLFRRIDHRERTRTAPVQNRFALYKKEVSSHEMVPIWTRFWQCGDWRCDPPGTKSSLTQHSHGLCNRRYTS